MDLKNIFRMGCLGLLALSAGHAFAAKAPASDGRPNFLIIMADDLGYGDLGIHGGYAPTPHLDKLFESGMVMENFMVNPLCSPTRASLLTGCNPLRLNQGPFVDAVLSTSVPTFGSTFQKHGYKTGVFGKWHNSVAPVFDPSMPDINDYGFDEWLGGFGGGFDFFTKIWPNTSSIPCWYHNRTHVTNDMVYATDDLTDYALRFMQANKDGNFVCYLPHMAMHEPIHVKEADLKKVPKELVDAAGGLRPWKEYYALINKSNFGGRLYQGYVHLTGDHSMDSIQGKLSDADMRVIYAAMLISLDENVGRLLAYLKESGLEKNTVVWFFSDNGGEHRNWVSNEPLRGSKHTIWEGGIHSRAVVRWPAVGWDVHKTFGGLMGSLDVYPTCMAMAGLPVPGAQEIDGRPCFEAMQNNTSTPVEACYYLYEDADAIRTEQWKLIRRGDHAELYNIKTDPSETTDVAAQHPEMAKELVQKLDAWMTKNTIAGGHVPHKATQQTAEQPHPAPLEVRFVQTEACTPPKQTFVRIQGISGFRMETGDQLEYDIRFDEASKTDGGHFTMERSTRRPLLFNLAVDQFGHMFSADYSYDDARGKWVHRVVGIGHCCPEVSTVLGLLVTGATPGTYQFALDNIVVRRRDGSTVVLWKGGMPVAGSSAPKGISELKVYSVGGSASRAVSLSDAAAKVTSATCTPLKVNSTAWKGASDDLFRNAVVGDATPVTPTTDIADLFTGPDCVKQNFAVFKDSESAPGTVNHVDFSLPAPVNLKRVTVTLAADQPSMQRSINRLKFYASATAGTLAKGLEADVAIKPDYQAAYGSSGLAVSIDVPANNVRYFRVEVTANSNGPRVVEIDGFGTPVQ